MIRATIARGLAAGLIAGVLAGLVGLVAGEPSLDAAIALEPADPAGAEHDTGWAFTRPQQKAGLVAGSALVGLAAGAVFGLAAAWSRGRLGGDAWSRSLALGAVAVGALVLLPALSYPPSPPGAGDPATVGTRTLLYLATGVIGLLIAAAAWTGAHQLALGDLPRPLRQALVGAGVVVAAGVWLAVRPDGGAGADGLPAELVWRFRLGSIATQLTLVGGTAVVFGLLASRRSRAVAASGASGASGASAAPGGAPAGAPHA